MRTARFDAEPHALSRGDTPLTHARSHRREDNAANDEYGEEWCAIFAPLYLVKIIRKLNPPLLPPGGCAVCHTEDDSVGGHILSCEHRCASAVARTNAYPFCLCVDCVRCVARWCICSVCGECFPKLPKTAVQADGRKAPCCPLCRRACPKTMAWSAMPPQGAASLAAH